MVKPREPCRPPRPLLNRSPRVPRLGVHILSIERTIRDPVMPSLMAGLAYDSGIVTAARQDEGDLGVSYEIDLVHRTPWRNMVALRGDGEDRGANIAERYRPAVNRVARFEKIVLQVESAQIFTVHPIRHACRIGVPGHKIDHGWALSHEILMGHARPNEIV